MTGIHMWSSGLAPLILYLRPRWKWVVILTLWELCPLERTPVPIA